MTREHSIRVNEKDTQILKAAQTELEYDVPLGRVAREGAKRILADDTDNGDNGVSIR